MTLQEVCDGRSNMSLQGWNVSSELEEVIHTSRYVVVEKNEFEKTWMEWLRKHWFFLMFLNDQFFDPTKH